MPGYRIRGVFKWLSIIQSTYNTLTKSHTLNPGRKKFRIFTIGNSKSQRQGLAVVFSGRIYKSIVKMRSDTTDCAHKLHDGKTKTLGAMDFHDWNLVVDALILSNVECASVRFSQRVPTRSDSLR